MVWPVVLKLKLQVEDDDLVVVEYRERFHQVAGIDDFAPVLLQIELAHILADHDALVLHFVKVRVQADVNALYDEAFFAENEPFPVGVCELLPNHLVIEDRLSDVFVFDIFQDLVDSENVQLARKIDLLYQLAELRELVAVGVHAVELDLDRQRLVEIQAADERAVEELAYLLLLAHVHEGPRRSNLAQVLENRVVAVHDEVVG